MSKLLLFLCLLSSTSFAQVFIPSTAFTRSLLRSTNAAAARAVLGTGTNGDNFTTNITVNVNLFTNVSGTIRPISTNDFSILPYGSISNSYYFFNPVALSAQVPYTLNTSIVHTNEGFYPLVAVKQAGTNRFVIGPYGGIVSGTKARTALTIGADTSISTENDYALDPLTFGTSSFFFGGRDSSSGTNGSFSGAGSAFGSSAVVQNNSLIRSSIGMYSQDGFTALDAGFGGASYMRLWLDVPSGFGVAAYAFDTYYYQSSGNLLTLANATTNVFSINKDGGIEIFPDYVVGRHFIFSPAQIKMRYTPCGLSLVRHKPGTVYCW